MSAAVPRTKSVCLDTISPSTDEKQAVLDDSKKGDKGQNTKWAKSKMQCFNVWVNGHGAANNEKAKNSEGKLRRQYMELLEQQKREDRVEGYLGV